MSLICLRCSHNNPHGGFCNNCGYPMLTSDHAQQIIRDRRNHTDRLRGDARWNSQSTNREDT